MSVFTNNPDGMLMLQGALLVFAAYGIIEIICYVIRTARECIKAYKKQKAAKRNRRHQLHVNQKLDEQRWEEFKKEMEEQNGIWL